MVKNKINRVIIKATGPQPKAPDLEGYTRYDIPWNDGTGENLYIWMKPDGQSQDVFIGSDENLKVVTRSRDIIFKTNTAGVVSSSQAQATLRVIQTNAVYNYRLILSVDHETLTAAGGTAKVSAQLEAKIGDDIIYTKEVNPTFTLQDSVPGFSLDGSNITVANRTTTIGNPRTCTILATVNTEETGEEVFATIAVTQEGNYVESISLTKGNFSYDNAVASGQVINPNSTFSSPTFTFTSGSTTTVVPLVTYGTVTRNTTYSSQASEGFSAANTETGAVTVASRGSVIGNIRTSNTITRHEYYSFVPASGYDAKGQIDSELDSQATISQSANVPVSVTVVPDFTYPAGNIPASGGTKTPSIDADITITWSSGGTSTADETGDSGYTVTKTPNWSMTAANGFTIDSSTGTVTAGNRGTTEGNSYTSGDITLNLTVTVNIAEEYGGGSISDEESITKDDPIVQSANSRIQVFSKPTITEFTVEDIPAKGGTISSGTVTYHQASTWYYDSGETTEGPSYTEGGSVQFGSAITAASLGTTVKARSVVGTLTCTVSMNGQTSVEGDAVVYQQANTIVAYGDVNLSVQTPINCDVLGGSYKITPTASQVITYTSEATRAGNISLTYAQKSAMSGFTLNGQSVTVTENKSASVRNGYTVTVTATGEGSKSASKEVVFNQAAGTKSYADPVISVFTYPTIAAKGGTVTPTITYSQTWGWNDSTTDGGTITTGAALSFTGSKVTSEGSVSASTKGTTVSGVTTVDTVTLKVTLNNKSVTKAFTVQQAANAASYGNVTITGGTVSDIPASGGSVSSMSGISASQTVTYTSEATRAGDVDITYSTAVSAQTLGTTVKSRTKVGTLTATATGEGSKSATKSLDVYQAANSATYGNVTITGGSVSIIPASGGSVSSASGISASQTVSFTSGSTRAGEVSISYSTAVSAESKGIAVSGQTTAGTLTATATGEGSKSATKQFTVYQAANTQTQTGIRIVGDATGGSGWIPYANWDSIKANGRASDSTTTTNDEGWAIRFAGYKQYSYTSGATNEVYVDIIPSNVCYTDVDYIEKHDSQGFTLAPSYRGTTVGAARTGHVWWEEGGFVSNKLAFTQEANAATTITYSNPVVTLSNADDIPASGGSVSSCSISYSQSRVQNYTSGATSALSTVTSGGQVSWGNAVTASSLGTTVKARTKVGDLSASVTMNGKTGSSSISVYQAANSATTITYGTPSVTLTVSDIPAGGGSISRGTVTYSQSRTQNYTSGAISTLSALTSGGSVSYSSAVSASSLGTTVKNRTRIGTLTATVTMNGKSGSDSADVYQQANVRTDEGISYGSWNVSISASDFTTTSSEAAAGGESCTITRSASRSRTQNYSYTSGETSQTSLSNETATPSLSASGTGLSLSGTTATWANRGTTTGSRRSGTVTATYSGVTKSVTLYQEANSVDDYNYDGSTFTVTVGNWDCPASGGTCPLSASIDRVPVYTSGAEGSSTSVDVTSSTSWSVASGEAYGYLSGDNLIVSSRGTEYDTDSHNIYVEGEYLGYTDDDYARVAANNRTQETSSVSVSISASDTLLPAGGGSCSLSYGASYQYRYVYDSGSHSSWSTRYVTPTISGSGTGFSRSGATVTAADRGTTTGGLRSVTYRATYDGEYDEVTISQEANEITETTYSYSNISATADDIPASGGSVSSGTLTSVSCVPHYKYTSGSESEGGAITSLGNFDVDWGTAVSASSRGTTVGSRKSVGTLTFTVSYKYGTGSGSGGVTIYQEENSLSYTYGGYNSAGSGSSITVEATSGGIGIGIYRTPTYTSGVSGDREENWTTSNSSFSSGASWISGRASNNIALVGYQANTSTSSRTGSATITVDGYSYTLTITQKGQSNYLNVSPTSLSFTASGGTKSISIDTNESWTIS